MNAPKITNHTVRALETIIERLGRDLGDDHKTVRELKPVARKLWSTAEALDKVRASRSPLDTPAAHALKVAKLARTLDSEASAVFNRCSEIVRRGLQDCNQRIDAKVNLKPRSDAEAKEIREVFRSLDSKKQTELLGQWVRENKGPEMAAVLRAPAFLSGINDEMKASFEKSIIAKHAGAEYDEQAALMGLYKGLGTATDTARTFARSLIDPGNLAKIEREAAEADAATEGFNQSLQQ